MSIYLRLQYHRVNDRHLHHCWVEEALPLSQAHQEWLQILNLRQGYPHRILHHCCLQNCEVPF